MRHTLVFRVIITAAPEFYWDSLTKEERPIGDILFLKKEILRKTKCPSVSREDMERILLMGKVEEFPWEAFRFSLLNQICNIVGIPATAIRCLDRGVISSETDLLSQIPDPDYKG